MSEQIVSNNGPRVFEGGLLSKGITTAIVASRFNSFIVEKLVDGAMDALKRHGADAGDQSIFWVPGAFEIPLVASKLAASKRFDAIICLGAIIKGSTKHFDFIATEACKGIASASMQYNVPIAMGLITAENLEQAIDRAGAKMGNQGFSAAMTAIELVNLLRNIE